MRDLVEKNMLRICEENATGELREALLYHLSTGGKRIRSQITLEFCRAFSVAESDAIVWASSCELLHNATLIHDDLQDGDKVRRDNPTVWVKYGERQAINAGDMMLMLAYLNLHQVGDLAKQALLCRELAYGASRIVNGQSLELDLPLQLESSLLKESYRECIASKTGALFEMPLSGALALTGMEEKSKELLLMTVRPLGLIFQIQDDVIDLFGAKGRDIIGSDIAEGKISALVVEYFSLQADPMKRQRLKEILLASRDNTSNDDIHWAIQEFSESGALDACLADTVEMAKDLRNSELILSHSSLHASLVPLVDLLTSPLFPLMKQRNLWRTQNAVL
ncbi:MAG: hypothetical protein COT74_12800 [Bdellovibrionales bacterium CG10_big_fil_rev_8_21_14_0_10_45_34]|nr:MAG: hypothetical protein COT74_12800 [Bdellovibrionales bacterium CG10_big_fil_rev_8_21_14_0_10_45_34]